MLFKNQETGEIKKSDKRMLIENGETMEQRSRPHGEDGSHLKR